MSPNTPSSTAAYLDLGSDSPSGNLQMGESLEYSIFRVCQVAGITPLNSYDLLKRSVHNAPIPEIVIATMTLVAEWPNTTVPDPQANLTPQVPRNFDSSVLTSSEPVNSALQTGNVTHDGFLMTSSQPANAVTLSGRSGGVIVALQDSVSETGYIAVNNCSATSSELVATVAPDQIDVTAEHSHYIVRHRRRQLISNPQSMEPVLDVQRRYSDRLHKSTAPNCNK